MTAQNAVHTPGPWHRNIRAHGKYPTVFAGRNQHVAVVSQQEDGAETEANIDLIAAAPEQHSALKGARDALREAAKQFRCTGDTGHASMCATHADVCDAAIAKAVGAQTP